MFLYYRNIEENGKIEENEEIDESEVNEKNDEAEGIESNGSRCMSNSYSMVTHTLVVIAGLKFVRRFY